MLLGASDHVIDVAQPDDRGRNGPVHRGQGGRSFGEEPPGQRERVIPGERVERAGCAARRRMAGSTDVNLTGSECGGAADAAQKHVVPIARNRHRNHRLLKQRVPAGVRVDGVDK